MNRIRTAGAASVAAAAIAVLTLTGAGCDKASEPFKDAPRSGAVNSQPADVIEMPDGFSNVASKCDNGNRLYVIFHNDGSYGSVAVVPHDPTCR